MTRTLLIAATIALATTAAAQNTIAELDAYWAEAARTITEGDFEGYGALYHEDAVLVNLSDSTTYSIHQALDGWKHLFDDTAAGKAAASVAFRFTRTLHDETTAHQTGIFRYQFDPAEGEGYVTQVHFEALMVKLPQGWLCTMEYQKKPATDEEWAAAE